MTFLWFPKEGKEKICNDFVTLRKYIKETRLTCLLQGASTWRFRFRNERLICIILWLSKKGIEEIRYNYFDATLF